MAFVLVMELHFIYVSIINENKYGQSQDTVSQPEDIRILSWSYLYTGRDNDSQTEMSPPNRVHTYFHTKVFYAISSKT